MKIENLDKMQLESLIKEVLAEKLTQMGQQAGHKVCAPSGVCAVKLPQISVTEQDRLDTGRAADRVYTHDLLTLQESPRLGCGLMEMRDTTFDWRLEYDEIDYIIEGTLTIITGGCRTTAHAGELIYIPKGSSIQFSVDGYARFLYVTYPADWQNQA